MGENNEDIFGIACWVIWKKENTHLTNPPPAKASHNSPSPSTR
jgi:hypothetical protein